MEVKYKLNKLVYDQFGRPSGVLLLDKKIGSSAHDLVYDVRRKLKFDKVGHAGALDTFSSGLMLILVGKATKFSDQLMGMDKEYVASLVFGIKTETQDIEGQISEINTEKLVSKEQVQDALAKFIGGYNQFVSIFSSVKVAGTKLRKILRDPRYKYTITFDEQGNKFIDIFKVETGLQVNQIQVPRRQVKIANIELLEYRKVQAKELILYQNLIEKVSPDTVFVNVDFRVSCSKGTYIRQLAEDIGEQLGLPASLIALDRTRIGTLTKTDLCDLNDISSDKQV